MTKKTAEKQVDNEGVVSYHKFVTVCGRKVEAAYYPAYDETFLIPTNAQGLFRKGTAFEKFNNNLDAAGYLTVGGHYSSIALAGDDFDLQRDFA